MKVRGRRALWWRKVAVVLWETGSSEEGVAGSDAGVFEEREEEKMEGRGIVGGRQARRMRRTKVAARTVVK